MQGSSEKINHNIEIVVLGSALGVRLKGLLRDRA